MKALALAVLLSGCVSRAGPVVTDVRVHADGSAEVRRCELTVTWSPPGIVQDIDTGDCVVETRQP